MSDHQVNQIMSEALHFHYQGNLNEAEKRYRYVLSLQSDNIDALHYLGVIAMQVQQFKGALPMLERAVKLAPENVGILVNLSIALKELGIYDKALECASKAVSLSSENPQLQANLAGIYQSLGNVKQAEIHYKAAVTIAPNLADAWRNLALIAATNLDFELAKQNIARAKQYAPNALEVLIAEAGIYQQLGDFKQSVKLLRELSRQQPKQASVAINLATGLAELGETEEAISILQETVSANPDFLDAKLSLATLWQQLDEPDRAKTELQQVLKLQPENSKALVLMSKGTLLEDEQASLTAKMREIVISENQPVTDKIEIHYALAKLNEKARLWSMAFEHFDSANKLTLRQHQYDVQSDLRSMENIKAFFTAEKMLVLQELCSPGQVAETRPIFIVGMPRSGSTLVEQIISSHPEVYGAGEISNLSHHINAQIGLGNGMDCTAGMTAVDGNKLLSIAQSYLQDIATMAKGKKIISDKMLMNFLHIGLITLLFPKAKIIHCQREPLETCLSIFKHDFSRFGHHYACTQEDLGLFYNGYLQLMRHWEQVVPDNIINISYEKLVNESEAQIKTLIEKCELPWDPECLQFHNSKRRVATLSAEQVRKPIFRDGLKASDNYIEHLAPLKKALNV